MTSAAFIVIACSLNLMNHQIYFFNKCSEVPKYFNFLYMPVACFKKVSVTFLDHLFQPHAMTTRKIPQHPLRANCSQCITTGI